MVDCVRGHGGGGRLHGGAIQVACSQPLKTPSVAVRKACSFRQKVLATARILATHRIVSIPLERNSLGTMKELAFPSTSGLAVKGMGLHA